MDYVFSLKYSERNSKVKEDKKKKERINWKKNVKIFFISRCLLSRENGDAKGNPTEFLQWPFLILTQPPLSLFHLECSKYTDAKRLPLTHR